MENNDILTTQFENDLSLLINNIKDCSLHNTRIEDYLQQIENLFNKQQNIYYQKIQKLESLYLKDSLTNIGNREAFKQCLDILINQKNDSNFWVLFLDLDNFKNINDTYGHSAGDHILISSAKKIKSIIENKSEQIKFYRLGGDEFTLIYKNATKEEVETLSKQIILELQKSVLYKGTNLYVSASIGAAKYPIHGQVSEEIIKNADIAMYQAKQNGKNQFSFYNEKSASLCKRKIIIEQELISTLKHNPHELSLVFQPQIDAHTHKIAGIESLLRWNNSKLGHISPAEFIPIAENNPKIIQAIGKWTLNSVCQNIKKLIELELDFKYISVNVSLTQFNGKSFLEEIKHICKKWNIPLNKLSIEITEHVIINNPKDTIKTMQEIKNLGISISIDDFGTGYSSMMHLKDMPIDTIKIDKAFVSGIENDKKKYAITKSILGISHALKITSIAEGVETLEQYKILKKNGVNKIQGYLFYKPLPINELIHLLKTKNKTT